MTAVEIPLFVNPVAGRGRSRRRLARVIELLAAGGVRAGVFHSTGTYDLEKQLQRQVAAGAERVIVVGGDGSVHEAVNGLLNAGNTAALGLIPCGTGNDFAKAAGIPLDWQTATRLLADRIVSAATPRRVDAARMNGRYFANGAGIGFDAKVTRIARAYRRPMGEFVYLLAIFQAMMDGIATPELSIQTDDFAFTGPVTLVSISNGPWLGGMFHIAPAARNDDGQLELLIVAPVNRRRIVALLPKLVQGKHMDAREITHVPVRRVSVTSAEPVPSHLDGEVQPLTDRFDIEILPDALRLL